MTVLEAKRRVVPYGSWQSPITADVILAGTVTLSEVRLDGDDTYWLEGRPHEAGRTVLVRRNARGETVDLTPAPFNVRDRVHEYGGGAYAVAGGIVYFSNFDDNRVYRLAPGGQPEPITPETLLRYADLTLDVRRQRLLCIREDHSLAGREAINTVVAIDLTNGEQTILAQGNDFYSDPRPSPDGSRLVWLTWNHPNLPWDGTELWLADLDEHGLPRSARRVAGGPTESIQQPRWSPDGALFFISDRTGWWNLYRLNGEGDVALTSEAGEFGGPQWVFGISTYAFTANNRVVAVLQQQGLSHLVEVDLGSGKPRRLGTPYVAIGSVQANGDRVAFLGASSARPAEIVSMRSGDGGREVLRTAGSVPVSPEYFSAPEPIEFSTSGERTAHALFYPPHNPNFTAPSDDLPPLIVASHGGPTGATMPALNLGSVQFWTSRGFAVVDVNYGGSTGYGREYRERLYGQWGVVDVEDCANAARFLAEQSRVDGDRLAIHGGSAGGYTTLAALAFSDVFNVGCSYFGIGDLTVFVHDTHKFESRYLDRLIGPLPESIDLYRQRSPINSIDNISCPVILFQGADDKVVPPNQATLTAEALDRKGLPYALEIFPGEGHGFRQAPNIKKMIEGELYFYSRVLGFDLPEEVETVKIENL